MLFAVYLVYVVKGKDLLLHNPSKERGPTVYTCHERMVLTVSPLLENCW